MSVAVATARGSSPADVAASIAEQIPARNLSALLVFASPTYDANALAIGLADRYGAIPVYGCTTAGELTPDGWTEGSVVALGFRSGDFTIVAQPILDLANFRVDDGRSLGQRLRADLARLVPDVDEQSVFGLLLIDGMCRREEAVISAIYASLDDIPVVGGSAGDDLRFERTFVMVDGRAHADAAVLILIKTALPFRLVKCDYFEPTSTKMVVTEADIPRRIVKELNAEPAAQEYSRTVGLLDTKLDAFSFAAHPLLVGVGGEYYARSIQRMNDDSSLSFFCAIDEGLVLTVARRCDPFDSMRQMFTQIETEIGEVSMYIGFDCVLRRLDAEQHQYARDMSQLYRANRIVGFNTYGEQYRSMHVNQTFTGVAIGRRQESAP